MVIFNYYIIYKYLILFICVEPGNILHCLNGTPCMRELSHQGTEITNNLFRTII